VIKAKKLSELQIKGLALFVASFESFFISPFTSRRTCRPKRPRSAQSFVFPLRYSNHYTQERISKLVDVGRVCAPQTALSRITHFLQTVLHYGWIPLIIYIGYTRSTPQPTIIKYVTSVVSVDGWKVLTPHQAYKPTRMSVAFLRCSLRTHL